MFTTCPLLSGRERGRRGNSFKVPLLGTSPFHRCITNSWEQRGGDGELDDSDARCRQQQRLPFLLQATISTPCVDQIHIFDFPLLYTVNIQ